MAQEHDEIYADLHGAVNMTANALETHLESDDSRRAYWRSMNGHAVDVLKDAAAVAAEAAAVIAILRELVHSARDELSEREHEVLQLRYGLRPGGEAHTLQELADLFKVSRERVQQIEGRALRKLKKGFLSAALSEGESVRRESRSEAIGHEPGQRLLEILRKKKAELDEADFAHMKKVTGYVHHYLAQKPEGDFSNTNWRYSLMNWGHDPLQSNQSK